MDDSTRKPRQRKAAADRPKKPYPDFPLTVHASGKWQKKINGKIRYFGHWAKRVNGKLVRVEGDGWKEALELYKAQADDLHAGRTPQAKGDNLTIKDLCNRFLTVKHQEWGAGKISARMYQRIGEDDPKGEYPSTTGRLVKEFGGARLVDDLRPDDFGALRVSLEKQFGPVRLGNEIQKVRTVFKFATDNGLTQKAVIYGSLFKKPKKSELRKHRAERGTRLFDAGELRTIIDGAGVQLKAMILLGINAGFGNTDCGRLPMAALNMETGWVEFPRPKTGIMRRCPLWPETIEAVKVAIDERPTPKDDDAERLVFVTKYGRAWSKDGSAGAVSLETGKLLGRLKIRRAGVGFYSLRHTFRTIADATKDPNAIRLIMGHTDDSIDANYTHGIDDDRLLKVTEHVRQWLFGKAPQDDGADNTDATTKEKREPRQAVGEGRAAAPALRLYAPEGGAA